MSVTERVIKNKIQKSSELTTFAAKPAQEHYTDSFSLKSRHGKRHIVMNMGLSNYQRLLEDENITRVRVLALDSGECYIVDDRVPYEYYR